MDHQYGIAVTNKFSLFLDEDEDPLEVLSRQEEQAKTKKKEEGDKKSSKSKQKKSAVPETKAKIIEVPVIKKEEKVVPPKQNERGRGGARNRENREPREIRDNDGDKRPPRWQGQKDNREGKVGDENVPPEFRERPDGGFRRREDRGDRDGGFGGERGRSRGRGRGRGSRGGERGGERGGFGVPRGGFGGERKREFDRHSGAEKTGIKPTDKKEGGGAHNWGTVKDDIEDREQVTPNESNEWASQPEAGVENPEHNETTELQSPPEDPQAHEMTLDEWKALQTQHKPKAQFNIRQPGEGEDGSKWSKGREYHKKHEDEDDEEEESEEEEDEEERHSRGKHLVTDIRITFNDNPRRGRGRRGGRGGIDRGSSGGRGTRGGMRGMGGKPRESAPRFDDEADFPSLVKSAA